MKDEFLEILEIWKKAKKLSDYEKSKAIAVGKKIYNDYYFNSLSFEEISEKMDISIDTIKRFIEFFKKPQKEKDRKKSKGWVYFLQAENGLIKIGYSTDVNGRVETIQSLSPLKVNLLTILKGSRSLEANYHKTFAKHKHHGEWFETNEPLMNLIETIKKNEQ